ncbi:MAG: hypothetical protein WAU17_19485 [Nitrospirales bacterium]
MVELSDQANVVADAVLLVPNVVSTDYVTYAPTLTPAGMMHIYAKWTESATRAQAVIYTVQHAGGQKSQADFSWVNRKHPSHRSIFSCLFPGNCRQ